MEHIQQTLFASASLKKPAKVKSERSELFDWFLSILNPDRRSRGFSEISYPRLGRELQGIPTKDLYALQSKMKDAMRRNGNPSSCFWYAIKPPKDGTAI